MEPDWSADPLDYGATSLQDSQTQDLHQQTCSQICQTPQLPQLRPLVETGPEAEYVDSLMQEALADLGKVH